MEKINIEKYAKHIDENRRPYGFMLTRMLNERKPFSYLGCFELRKGREYASFFYRLFQLDPDERTYQLSLFADGTWNDSFFDVIVTYLDHDPQLITYEVVSANGDWEVFVPEFMKLLHMLVHESIIDMRRPVKADGKLATSWLSLYDRRIEIMVKEHIYMDISEVVSTCNLFFE